MDFLKTTTSFRPIPVRIQKENETLEIAIEFLLQACKKNGYRQKILIKTNDLKTTQLLSVTDTRIDDSLMVVDNLDKFCKEKERFLTV